MPANKKLILIIIFILAVVFVIIRAPILSAEVDTVNGDAGGRYHPIATNLAAGNGFSAKYQPPFEPDNFDQPGYPFFVASIYYLTGGSSKTIAIIQCLLELAIILLALKLGRVLKLSGKETIVSASLAVVSPFLAIYSNKLYTEVVATFALILLCLLFVLAAQNKSFRLWAAAAFVGGLCLLIRPDTMISVALMTFIAGLIFVGQYKSKALPQILVFFAVITLVMLPWTIRNYNLYGKIKPLGIASEQTKLGYVRWLNTWLVEPSDVSKYWWDKMNLKPPPDFPEDEFCCETGRRVENLLKTAQSNNSFDGEVAAGFSALADETYGAKPFKSYVSVPLRRTFLTVYKMPMYVEDDVYQTFTYTLWTGFLGFALTGIFILLKQKIFYIPVALITGRLLLPAYTAVGAEPRYIIEALPIFYIAAAVGIVWLARKVQAARMKDKAADKGKTG
jgi:4-amino-4-deoxy-L-arabinose transferase-like glycosyltransferase